MANKKSNSRSKKKVTEHSKAGKEVDEKTATGEKSQKESDDEQKADKPPLASLVEVAKMLRLSPLQVKKMARSGQIPGVKVEGEWRFNRDLVLQAIKRRSLGR